MNPQMAIAITGKNMAKPAFDSVVADANRAGAAVHDNGARMGQAMGGASFQTANLAAQFNDIGVMLASGQSPLLLALQQGTQISQVLGPMGAAQAVKSLQAAFLSLFSPVSLVTVGTIAAGAAMFQYFTSINGDGRASTEVIKEQNEAIRATAERWGAMVPALQAYVEELDRAAQAGQQQTAKEGFIAAQFSEANAVLDRMMPRLAGLSQTLRDAGANGSDIQELTRSFTDLDSKIEAGTARTEDAERASRAMASFVGGPGAHAVAEFGASFAGLSGLVTSAANAIAAFNTQAGAAAGGSQIDPSDMYRDAQAAQFQFAREQERINSLTTDQLTLEREVARVLAEAKTADVVLSEQQALSLAQQRLDADQRRFELQSSIKTGGEATGDINRERQAVSDLIAELEHEQSLIGMTNTDKAVQNALRQAGAAATDEERRKIEELITVTEEHEAAQKRMSDMWDQYGNIGKSAIRGVKDALKDGKIEANEFFDILGNVGDRFLDMALDGLFSGFGGFGGRTGGGLGGLLGFSEGGGGMVGGGSGYISGAADNTLFVAKAQKGEPFAFGDTAINGLGGRSGGTSVVKVTLDEGLRAEIVQQAAGQAIEVSGQMIKPVAAAVGRMSSRGRFG